MHIQFILLVLTVSIAFCKDMTVNVKGMTETGETVSVPYTFDITKIKPNDNTMLDAICGKVDMSAKWDTHYLDAHNKSNAFKIVKPESLKRLDELSRILPNLDANWTILVHKRDKPLNQGK
ncbi:hypothetical protein Ddc_19443 [Ditylenchus destructor]|nr:hypothetical protein Ddc_19443 [Ditylenchus destructor]